MKKKTSDNCKLSSISLIELNSLVLQKICCTTNVCVFTGRILEVFHASGRSELSAEAAQGRPDEPGRRKRQNVLLLLLRLHTANDQVLISIVILLYLAFFVL